MYVLNKAIPLHLIHIALTLPNWPTGKLSHLLQQGPEVGRDGAQTCTQTYSTRAEQLTSYNCFMSL